MSHMILHLPDSMTCPLAHLQSCQVVVTAVNDLHLKVTKLADTQLHVSGQQTASTQGVSDVATQPGCCQVEA